MYVSFSITGALTCHFEICCARKSDEATGERRIKVVAERGERAAAVFGIQSLRNLLPRYTAPCC